jgi:Protein of unknown function (DUF4235)
VAKKSRSAEEKAAKKKAEKGRRAWKLVSSGVGIASGIATTRALDATWKTATGRKPPTKPENPAIAHREALVWAALSGMALGVTRTYVIRRAAMYWVRSFGTVPPGMNEADESDKRALRRLARGKY